MPTHEEVTEKEREKTINEQLFPEGFFGLRTGLREHIDDGRFTVTDAAVYLYLHAHARFTAGVCVTNAITIATKYGAPISTVQDSLARLRNHGYINYNRPHGGKGSYPIIIHKYRPTDGVMKGFEVDAFAVKDFSGVEYVWPGDVRVLAVWKPCADRVDDVLISCVNRVLTVTVQDIKN